jgi:hypothetical protein
MSMEFSKHGREVYIYILLMGMPERKRHYEDLGLRGTILLKWIIETGSEVVHMIHMPLDSIKS